MQIHSKTFLWILGLLILAVSLLGIGISIGMDIAFLQNLPQNLLYYFITTGVLGLIGIVMGLSTRTY